LLWTRLVVVSELPVTPDTLLLRQRRAQLRALVPARGGEPPPAAATPSGSTRAGRVPWAELLRRVFATDVLSCPCGSAIARAVLGVLVENHAPCP